MTPKTPSTTQRIPDHCYEQIRQLVYDHSRINLGDNKRELVQSRLAKRLRALDIPSYDDYCTFVSKPQSIEELEHLINAISTNHTFFFREPQHFDFLSHTALPKFIAKKPQRPFRFWSSASSSGEEAYTTSIVISEFFRTHGNHPWRIECTDISSNILKTASEGIYKDDKLNKIPQETLRRYFQRGEKKWKGYYRIKKTVREHIHFQLQNLLKPPYPFKDPFDVIFCRNVMIYFDRETQEELVNHLANCLVPGGYLMIGHSESLTGVRHPYKSIQPAVYQKP